MNIFQKAGTFAARCIGLTLVSVGISGPIFVAVINTMSAFATEYPPSQWIGSVVWTVCGAVILWFAVPIGRLLGRGLD